MCTSYLAQSADVDFCLTKCLLTVDTVSFLPLRFYGAKADCTKETPAVRQCSGGCLNERKTLVNGLNDQKYSYRKHMEGKDSYFHQQLPGKNDPPA